MTAIAIANEIITRLRELPDTGFSPENIRADDKIPPDAWPAIQVSPGITEIDPVNLREQPANDPANIARYSYRFNVRVTAEAYLTDGDGMFAASAAPGLAEKIRALPRVMFAADSRRRITWVAETPGEYVAEETEPRPFVDMTLHVEMIRAF